MSFGRDKRLLLGALAFLAPLPLPFNELLEWPFLAAYWAALVLFLRRAWRDPGGWLPNWAVNLLGLLYLPFLLFDLSLYWRGQVVRPLIHLAMYALVIKLCALRREKDKWHALIGAYFLFLAAMGTSVHPSIAIYLVAFLVLSLLALVRFAFFHVLAGFGYRSDAGQRVPLRAFLAAGTVLTLAAAVPLFAVLPRVRTPYILGRGAGTGTIVHASGFSDEVTLDDIGRVRTSREVAMRLEYEAPAPAGHERRFKAATYDRYLGRRWLRSPIRDEQLRLRRDGLFQLAPGEEPVAWVHVWLQPLRSTSLILPTETVAVELQALALAVDEGGGVSVIASPGGPLEYRAGMAPAPRSAALPPEQGWADGALDTTGLTPRIAELAARVAGSGSARERAARLESHLIQSYDYTLDFVGRMTDEPLEDFLFRYRSGHCEYFASALVLMLRSQGIPARLVAGYLGAEYNPLEGYYIVRQRNAHAWVEAWIDGAGWRILDPTPPSGRPVGEPPSLKLLASQLWDYVLFRWDRYVLTYGFYDQLRVFARVRQLWAGFWRQFQRPPTAAPEVEGPAVAEPGGLDAPAPAGGWAVSPLWWAALLLAVLAAAWWIWSRRPRLTATRAFRRLRRRLAGAGSEVAASVPPLAVRERVIRRWPEAARPAARIVDLYLDESFGARDLGEGELAELHAAVRAADRAMGM